jgi:hypothetical protein
LLPDTCRAGALLGGGLLVGGALGERLGVGLLDGLELREGLVVGLVELTEPVQVTPFRVKEVGTGLLPFQAPLKPIVTVEPVPTAPL